MDRKSEKYGYGNIRRMLSSGADEEEKATDIEAQYGRDPTDKEGEASTICRSAQRVAEIFAYYCICGCLLEKVDRAYSNATENKPVIGEGRKQTPGVSHLTTDFMNTSLTLREADEKSKTYQGFVNRYFKQCDVWHVFRQMQRLDPSSKEFEQQEIMFELKARVLKDQLYDDTVDRRTREDASAKNIAALGMFMSLLAVTIGLVNTYLEQNDKRDATSDVNYVQMVIGAAVAYVIKMISSYKSDAGRAAQNFDGLVTWVWSEVERLEEEIKLLKEASHKSEEVDEAETQLNALKEALLQVGFANITPPNGQMSLLDAVAVLRQNQGHAKEKLADRFTGRDRHQVAAVAVSLGCPVMVLSEARAGADHQLHTFNEVLEYKDDKVQEEQEMSTGIIFEGSEPTLPSHPENYMVLYTPAPNEYHPVLPPFSFNKPLGFADAKKALTELVGHKNQELRELSTVAQAKM